MTKEALKLALEALEEAADAIDSWGSYASGYFQVKHDLENDISKAKSAITAIKEALEQQDSKNKEQAKTDSFVRQLDEALAQPEQEPVACVVDGDLYFHHEIDWEDLAYQGYGVELLYTTPPQRTWVGLTDEDLGFLFPHGKSVWLQETVKIIEAKLKEKNT